MKWNYKLVLIFFHQSQVISPMFLNVFQLVQKYKSELYKENIILS